MNSIFFKRLPICSIAIPALMLTMSVQGQQYKTLSDTTQLNKKYGEISLEISKLNTKLIEEKNKTVDYHSKSTSSAGDAVATAQASKDQADVATSGNTTDTKKAVKDAKEADNKANDAKDAVADEKSNAKKIRQLSAQIDQKQKLLRDLDAQRAAILAGASVPEFNTPADSTKKL
jgi:type II secretory pathway component GspD/PulD (secretin)